MLPAITIFLGSFLLFLVQPLVARALLPIFGGTSSVWISSCVAFQVLLLVGYGYAHCVAACRPRLHAVFLIMGAIFLAALSMTFTPLAKWASCSISVPVLGTAMAVVLTIGLPYVLFSANASFVQTLAGGAYRLYALSNVGSLVGLFAHPLLMEPFLSIEAQENVLFGLSLVYAILACRLAITGTKVLPLAKGIDCQAKSVRYSPVWFALPALTCFLLNALTAHLTTDIAPLPLLWAILLGVYLLTYAIGFSPWGERLMPLWAVLGLAGALAAALVRFSGMDNSALLFMELGSGLLMMLFGGAALHARLCRSRPGPQALTLYNFMLAVGGAVGGLASGLVAPLIFDSIVEYPIALALLAMALGWVLKEWILSLKFADKGLADKLYLGLSLIFVFLSYEGYRLAHRGDLAHGRSFYGSWRVYEERARNRYGKEVDLVYFKHGGTIHGAEAKDPFYRTQGTAYYGPRDGGLAVTTHPKYVQGKPLRVGLVGLGVGTMAFYGRKDDIYHFYEICSQVAKVAFEGPWFDFVSSSVATVDVALGDARCVLEAERACKSDKWDVLVIDAYSGDSIPIQLITKEAFRLYRERLASGGTLALHLSNWHIDLVPAAKAAARLLGLKCHITTTAGSAFTSPAVWAFLTDQDLRFPPDTDFVSLDEVPEKSLPTDDCGSLLPYLRLMM